MKKQVQQFEDQEVNLFTNGVDLVQESGYSLETSSGVHRQTGNISILMVGYGKIK
jgi:hypothetical protein